MREPKRLLTDGATDFERQLLRAVAGERPSPLIRARMRRGLGLVGPLAWAGNVKAMFATLTTKGAVGVAVGSILAAGGLVTAVSLSSGWRSEALGERNGSPPALVQPALEPDIEQEMPHALAVPTARVAALPVAEVETVSSQLREEIAVLDRARAALQQGARARARSALKVYARLFPDGVLRREAALLRQQAAVQKPVTREGANHPLRRLPQTEAETR